MKQFFFSAGKIGYQVEMNVWKLFDLIDIDLDDIVDWKKYL